MMKFTIFALHCKGPILKTKFWAERTVVLRSSVPPLPPGISVGHRGYWWDPKTRKVGPCGGTLKPAKWDPEVGP